MLFTRIDDTPISPRPLPTCTAPMPESLREQVASLRDSRVLTDAAESGDLWLVARFLLLYR